MIDFTIDASELIAFGKKLEKVARAMPQSAADAVNKGLDVGQPDATSRIVSTYNVGAAPIDVKRASPGASGHLKASSGMLPVSQFSPMKVGKGVSVSILRGSRKLVMGAFMVGGRVMERRQPSKYPIYPVSTIGVAGMFGAKKVSVPVQELMVKTASDELGRVMENL